MYNNSLKKIDISICQSQRNIDLAISEESFPKKYGTLFENFFGIFSNILLLETLVIENKGADITSKRFENSQSFILDKILTKYLPQSGCKLLKNVTISGSFSNLNILGDLAAKEFFGQTLSN
jgi:hypothetical protein